MRPVKVLLPKTIVRQLNTALRRAGTREMGGILMGEHVDEGVFRVRAITVQSSGGTNFSFRRLFQAVLAPLQRFYHQTHYDYARFNYLGEWHSHPSFSLEPSRTDAKTMWELVHDPQVGANFAVLLIVHLTAANIMDGAATIFLPEYRSFRADLIQEID